MKKRLFSLFLGLVLLSGNAQAAVNSAQLDTVLEDVARYICETVPNPQVAAIGGEWAVIGLARSGYSVDEGYFDRYCLNLETALQAQNGVLHSRKYTEYARVILALSALGKDAREVESYDLTLPLADFDKTLQQGLNGPIWALIALDSANYPMPSDPKVVTQATRQMYIDEILAWQLPDGGWSLSGTGGAEPDITGMALQALAKYRSQSAVAKAIDKALTRMSSLQNAQGGYAVQGESSAESCAQMVVALATLDIDQNDPRFVKSGNSILDALLSYYTVAQGFSHTAGAVPSQMTTEQGLCALAAVRRFEQGKTGLYDMSDAVMSQMSDKTAISLAIQAIQAVLCCLIAVQLP